MNFDVRQSRLAVWLNVIGAIIAIAGVLGKAFSTILPFANVPISMPLWALLAVVGLLPSLALLVAKQYGRHEGPQLGNDTTVSSSMSSDSVNAQGLEAELAGLRAELASYKSLEEEIMGLLASGEELSLNEILDRLAIKHQPSGPQQLRLAIASLQKKGQVAGTGGLMARLRSVPSSMRESA